MYMHLITLFWTVSQLVHLPYTGSQSLVVALSTVCIGALYIDRTVIGKKLYKLQIFILWGNVSSIKISGSVFTWASHIFGFAVLIPWGLNTMVANNGDHYFTEWNGILGKHGMSSLKCLISMSCIQLDKAHRCWVLHAGTLVARIRVSRKKWMCKHEGGSLCKANSGRNTNPQVPAVWVPACRTVVRSYIAVCVSEYSVPFC